MGAYSRWALIRGWALIRINTVILWSLLERGATKTGNLFCIIAAKLACKRGVIFSRLSGELKQARSERGARDIRNARRGKALLARFALVFARLKLTPVLQATVKRAEERCYAFYHQRLDPVLQQLRSLQVAKSCWRNYRVVLLFNFGTKSVHVARFTGPRQTCLAASDETPVYGVTAA